MAFDDKTLDESIDALFEAAEKEKYVHSRSKEVFDAIAGLWLLGDDFEAILARVGQNYIVSSFLLRSLELIYKRISMDYDLPEFHAIDLTNSDARESFQTALQKLGRDSRFMQWLKDDLLPVYKRLLDSDDVYDLDTVSRLGNLSDSIQRTAELCVDQEDGEIWVYDSVFQFAEEVLEDRATAPKSISNYLDTDPAPNSFAFDAPVSLPRSSNIRAESNMELVAAG